MAGWHIPQSDWWQDGVYIRVTDGRMTCTSISEREMAGWHIPQGDRWQHEMYLKVADGRMD